MIHRAMLWAAVAVFCLLSSQVALAAPAQKGVPPVPWGACSPALLTPVPPAERALYTCATFPVPIDYGHPQRGSIGLALLRRAATDQAHRIGSLFLNPGGPGGSGLTLPIGLSHRLDPTIGQRFDMIGFDPRGVANSAPLRCFTTNEQAQAVFNRIIGVPITPAEIASTLTANRDYTRDCALNAGPLLDHMSTLDVALDLDRMRQAVGDSRLNYLGFSYGTLIGATYANLFPHRVRAVILDGNVDPKLRTEDGLEYLRQRAVGQEEVLNAFLQACANAGSPRCAFGGGDPAAKFVEIRTRLRQGPVTLPGAGAVTLSRFTSTVAGALYRPAGYQQLATLLQSLFQAVHPTAGAAPAVVGPGEAQLLNVPATAGLVDTPFTGDDSFLGVNCADEPFPQRSSIYVKDAARWERQAPTVGRQHAFSQEACGRWPADDPERYTGPWNRRTSDPVLLFGNFHDPATNFTFDQRMAAELGNDRFVSVNSFGHTILGGRSACADAIAGRYLVDLVLPARGTLCQPDTQPFM